MNTTFDEPEPSNHSPQPEASQPNQVAVAGPASSVGTPNQNEMSVDILPEGMQIDLDSETTSELDEIASSIGTVLHKIKKITKCFLAFLIFVLCRNL